VIALAALVNRRRGTGAYSSQHAAAPIVSTNVDNPVLIIHGSAQLLQGAAVTFDTATTRAAGPQTADLGVPRHETVQGLPRHDE